MKLKAVLFDLYGVLVDNYDIAGYSSALRETGSILKIKPEDFIRVWQETTEKQFTGEFKALEDTLEYICKTLGVPVKPFDVRLAKMVRYDYLGGLLAPRRYVIETLGELKGQGVKLAVVSNCSGDTAALWPSTPFATFFDATIFSSRCGFQKPDERIYRAALEELGAGPAECLFVDDNSANLTAAAAMGFHCALMTDAEGKEQKHFPHPSTDNWTGKRIKDLPEVLDILEEQA